MGDIVLHGVCVSVLVRDRVVLNVDLFNLIIGTIYIMLISIGLVVDIEAYTWNLIPLQQLASSPVV